MTMDLHKQNLLKGYPVTLKQVDHKLPDESYSEICLIWEYFNEGNHNKRYIPEIIFSSEQKNTFTEYIKLLWPESEVLNTVQMRSIYSSVLRYGKKAMKIIKSCPIIKDSEDSLALLSQWEKDIYIEEFYHISLSTTAIDHITTMITYNQVNMSRANIENNIKACKRYIASYKYRRENNILRKCTYNKYVSLEFSFGDLLNTLYGLLD